MSKYAVMPLTDYKDACDAIRRNNPSSKSDIKSGDLYLEIENLYTYGTDIGRSEGYQSGWSVGYENGKTDGYGEGYNDGYDAGVPDGYKDGESIGYGNGFNVGKEEGIIEGKQAEYDAFWDIFQDYGNRKFYSYAFYGDFNTTNIWNDNNFKPKYDIVIGTSQYASDCMFQYCAITDLKSILENQGVVLDFSKTARLNGTFDRSTITSIPPIDLSACTSMIKTFQLIPTASIELNNLRADCTFTGVFASEKSLKNLTITGTIGQSGFDVSYSTSLSKASFINIVNVLSDSTTGLSISVSKTAVNKAFETSSGAKNGSTSEEWLNLIATKPNWAINLK